METAINLLWKIYQQFTTFIFSTMTFNISGHSISFGWVIVAIFVFNILIRNLLMLPKKSMNINLRGNNDD